MPAKFEDLPLEAHSLISRHLNRSDCFEMRQTCSLWRYVLNYEIEINVDTALDICQDAISGKSLLDFEYIEIKRFICSDEKLTSSVKKLHYALLRIVGNRVIHLTGRNRFIFCDKEILPNLKTIRVKGSICDSLNADVCWQFKRLNEFRLLYEIQNIKNSMEVSERFLFESCGSYMTELILLRNSTSIINETLQRRISTLNNLQMLDYISMRCPKLMKMCAIHLPATTPLKKLTIMADESIANTFEIFCKKWSHSLEIIYIILTFDFDVISITYLKRLKTLHTLKVWGFIHLPRFELYNAIASEMNNNFQELSIGWVDIEEEEIISILENLPRLRKLKLNLYQRAITDRTLATIFSKLTKLRDLHITCYDCTDAGFLGFGDTPYPISRLRGLTQLGIGSNKNITERILPEIVRLKELRDIKLDDVSLYPKLLKILSNDCCADLKKEIEKRAILVKN